jgi:ribonuclease P protein subunit RPR2
MAKKAGRAAAEPTAATPVPSRDALQRLSYLYQASVLLNNIDLDSTTRPKKRRKLARTPTREGNGRSSQTKDSVREEEEKGRDQDQDERKPAEELALEPNYPLPETVYGNNDEVQPVQGGALKPVSQHLVRMMQDVAKKATVRM